MVADHGPQRAEYLIRTCGVRVPFTKELETDLREAGAEDNVIAAVKEKAPKPAERVVVPPPPPASPEIKVNSKDGQRYVWILPGKFTMGCSFGDDECHDDEKPSHEVEIAKGYWLAQTPVTVGAWKKVNGKLPEWGSSWKVAGTDHDFNPNWADLQQPVIGLTWPEASQFCEAIGGRLPTEAEWEYAARAGSKSARYGALDSIAWYADNSGKQRLDSAELLKTDGASYAKRLLDNGNGPHDAGLKDPNAWKLYDMLGNVWQWTADWYDAKYYARGENQNPLGPPGGESRSLRGGSWGDVPRVVRASVRLGVERGDRYNLIGFRCVGE
jgi:sulfatase modifying factor 1